ncbi:hypothetical protein BKA93DRAFT_799121 [Sparassis latifolia]
MERKGGGWQATISQTRFDQRLRTPRPIEMDMDGLVFRAAYLSASITLTSITTLTISNFAPVFRDHFKAVGFVKFWHPLTHLRELTLVNVKLECFFLDPPVARCRLEKCTFEGVTAETLRTLLVVLNNANQAVRHPALSRTTASTFAHRRRHRPGRRPHVVVSYLATDGAYCDELPGI